LGATGSPFAPAPRVPALRCWLFAALALGCAIGSAPLLHSLNRQRDALGLTGLSEGTGGVPPEIVATAAALGPFRAVLIDLLWMRATELQDQGQFFELVQLYDWISKLEPRFPLVWEYMAWNFAYNISVKFSVRPAQETPSPDQPDPHELRWQWVNRGIEVLRDRGIRYNPRAYSLYRELAWIYSHKIGQTADDANVYFKIMLAMQMQAALGQPPYLERLKAIAAAPETEADLLRDPLMAALVGRVRDAGVDPFAKPLDLANRSADLPALARNVLDAPDQAPLVARLDAFLRAQHLRTDLKLDPSRMADLMVQFGPIDWRLPDALALYWANRSIDAAGVNRQDAVNADRIQFHSLTNLYRRGRLIVHPIEPGKPLVWIPAPNFEFLDRIVKLHQDDLVVFKGTPQEVPYHEGYLNFLREAVVDLYLSNQVRRAARFHRLLKEIGPEPKDQSLEDFITGRWDEIARTLNAEQCRNLLQSIYVRALDWASLGDLDQAAGQERLAQLLARIYERERPHLPLPHIREIKRAAFREALRRFQDFQIQRLREFYPEAVKDAEAEIEKEKEKQKERPSPVTRPK
jgi:hypothetical protein